MTKLTLDLILEAKRKLSEQDAQVRPMILNRRQALLFGVTDEQWDRATSLANGDKAFYSGWFK